MLHKNVSCPSALSECSNSTSGGYASLWTWSADNPDVTGRGGFYVTWGFCVMINQLVCRPWACSPPSLETWSQIDQSFPFLISSSWRDWNALSFRVDIRYWESGCQLTYGFKVESGAKVSFNAHCQVAVVVHQEETFSRALNSSAITCISSALAGIMY